jgi:tetratricopeptide (TPR) repeat protein
MLAWAAGALSPEVLVDLADSVERLLAPLGHPQALAQAVSVRVAAARRLGAWSHAHFLNASLNIDHLLAQGDLPAAQAAAQQLIKRCLSAGAEAYQVAAYDIAAAYIHLGQALSKGGAAEEALTPLAESQQRFQVLADAGDADAAIGVVIAIAGMAGCLRALGRYEEAAMAYEEAIGRVEKLGDRRTAAAIKANLGWFAWIKNIMPRHW